MKARLLIVLLFVFAAGTSTYQAYSAPQKNVQYSKPCCGGDPGTPDYPQPQTPIPPPPPPSSK